MKSKLRFTVLFVGVYLFSISQICTPSGTISASLSSTLNVGPSSFNMTWEICGTGMLIDTMGGSYLKTYFLNPGAQLVVKAPVMSDIFAKNNTTVTILGGGSMINLNYESGAVITGTAISTNTCLSISIPLSGLNCISATQIDVKSLYKNGLEIYPNPAKNILHIESGELKARKVFLVNIFGKTEFVSIDKLNNIDISRFDSGIYFLIIETDSSKAIYRKLLIEN